MTIRASARRGGHGRVGIVGLGRMGHPVADNLISSGWDVFIKESTSIAAQDLQARGAHVVPTFGTMGEECDVILTLLPDLPQVREISEGADGLLARARPGTVIVVMGTVDPTLVKEFGDALRLDGFGVVDAPMSGGIEGARAGTLSIMMGGDEDDIAKVRPALEQVSTTLRRLGPLGAGQLSKACNQIVVAGTLALLGEAIVLARKGGLDTQTVLEVLGGGLASSQLLKNKWQNFLDDDFTATGSAAFQRKDLGFALQAARSEGVSLPVTALVDQLYGSLVHLGLGEKDHSSVIRITEILSGSIPLPTHD